MNSSLSYSLSSSDHRDRFGTSLDGPATGGDWERDGGGFGEEGRGLGREEGRSGGEGEERSGGEEGVASDHALSSSGRDWARTTGAGGT